VGVAVGETEPVKVRVDVLCGVLVASGVGGAGD
jgi:hypothetical protein